MKKKVLIALGIVVIGVAGWVVLRSRTQTPGGVACTLEAKLCPDGSYVGHTGPRCEFAPCPTPGSSGISGTVLLGPTCPVQRNPPDPQCADKPFAVSLVVTTVDGSRVIASITSHADGTFRVAVPPGEYAVRAATSASVLPRCNEQLVTVRASAYTATTITCDTGIR